jgi:nicotinate phosphoribosyltransferase
MQAGPRPYGESLALLTDLYQLTMAYGYWKAGVSERQAVFHLFFRTQPFGGGFGVACGLAPVCEFLDRLRFQSDDLDYLAGLRGADGSALFDDAFLDYLGGLRLACDVDAVPEGTAVFPHEPLVRICGPLAQGQLLETALLNLMNFQTLIATKSARVALTARDEPVLEFGLRRAQGIDGGLAASRAAYVGGAAATSNVLAGKLYGIPVLGTHAHSWVMVFEDEVQAFRAYARALPNNCIFLVDTYDSLAGVRHAIEVGRALREEGHRLQGIRLDSGDLAELSIEARRLLDDAGFADAAIVASSDLDEYAIAALKQKGARIQVWGVGTRLATAYDQPAIGGVYKLAAVREPGSAWSYRLKRSEEAAKTSVPGVLQVRRFLDGERFLGDAIYDVDRGIEPGAELVDPADPARRQPLPASSSFSDLLVPVYRDGRRIYNPPRLAESRARTQAQLDALPPEVRRLAEPQRYPVGLEAGLAERARGLLAQVGRGAAEEGP